jgi:hypothetical protein
VAQPATGRRLPHWSIPSPIRKRVVTTYPPN